MTQAEKEWIPEEHVCAREGCGHLFDDHEVVDPPFGCRVAGCTCRGPTSASEAEMRAHFHRERASGHLCDFKVNGMGCIGEKGHTPLTWTNYGHALAPAKEAGYDEPEAS